MPLAPDEFVAWLRTKGASEQALPLFREGAVRLAQAAGRWPMNTASLDIVLADMVRQGLDPRGQGNLHKIGVALVRFAEERPPPSRITFSGLAIKRLVGAKPRVEAPAVDNFGHGDFDEPTSTGIVLRGTDMRRRQVVIPDAPATTVRRPTAKVVFAVAAIIVAIVILVTAKATIEAYRDRSREVGENYFSEHLALELDFPKGWHHLVGADRREVRLPWSEGNASDGSTSVYFRGADPRAPDVGLRVVVGSRERAPSGMAAMSAASPYVARAAAEDSGLTGVDGLACQVENASRATCRGRALRGGAAVEIVSVVAVGTEKAAAAVFWTRPGAATGDEVQRVASSIRP